MERGQTSICLLVFLLALQAFQVAMSGCWCRPRNCVAVRQRGTEVVIIHAHEVRAQKSLRIINAEIAIGAVVHRDLPLSSWTLERSKLFAFGDLLLTRMQRQV